MQAIAYIDGYNLYYGSLKSTPNKWLNIQALAQALTPGGATLAKVRYFTAHVKPSQFKPSAHTDQKAYLSAIQAACPLVDIHLGRYSVHKTRAANANPPPATVEIIKSEEKGSDVNLAVHLLNDSYKHPGSIALLISNDSDLCEAVALAKANGTQVYWFPPLRKGRYPSKDLAAVVTHQRGIYPKQFVHAQFPSNVTDANGATICKPSSW